MLAYHLVRLLLSYGNDKDLKEREEAARHHVCMKKDPKLARLGKVIPTRNGARNEGSIVKLKARADKKREPKEPQK